MLGASLHQDRTDLVDQRQHLLVDVDEFVDGRSVLADVIDVIEGLDQLGPMMTFVNVTIDQWNYLCGLGRLDGVGGWVFTRGIEHTFENRVILMMREVLL